jgi:hypothetical protein
MTEPRTPQNISFETPHCFVRELELNDELELLSDWLSDPQIARSLNAPVGSTRSPEDASQIRREP